MNARSPQPGFSRLMRRISARISVDTAGRPGRPRRTLQVQNMRKAFRCQPITVSGFRIFSAERHSVHTRDSPIHSRRSALFNGRRFVAERCRTPIWWRSATFSSCRAARLFRADDTKASASERHSKVRGNTLRNVCNPHHLNYFVIYERHNQPVIAELQQNPLPEGYLDYLRLNFATLPKLCRRVS